MRSPILVAALVAVGCSGASDATPGGFPVTPYATVTSDHGALRIEVRTSPSQPPPRGTCIVELTVTDPNGEAEDDLTIDVVPWMPAMGHGASVKPVVTAHGGGKYVVSNVSLFMPGQWELRTTISGAVTDDAKTTFQIP